MTSRLLTPPLVSAADPDFQRKKHREVEYEFAGKVFYADPTVLHDTMWSLVEDKVMEDFLRTKDPSLKSIDYGPPK